MQKNTFFTGKRITLFCILAFMMLVLGLWFGQQTQAAKAPQMLSATVLPQPRDLTAFTLTDIHNQPFTNDSLKGHWTMVYFGFARCPKICPATMSMLNQMYKKIAADNKPLPQVVFVSLDPKRDTLENIQKFVISFNPAFAGVTGSKEQLAQITQELSVLFMKVRQSNLAQQAEDDYEIDHSGSIVLLDPAGKFYAVFSTPHDANRIAQDFENISAHYQA